MAKKKAKSSRSKKSSSAKTSVRKSTNITSAPKQVAPDGCMYCTRELEDEHRVLSHLMYWLFLFAVGFAAIFTVFLFTITYDPEYTFAGIKALVLMGWAALFYTFGHRIHIPGH